MLSLFCPLQDTVGTMARTIKATVNKNVLKEKLKSTTNLLSRLRQVAVEPQHALPDIFIWLISNNKRMAYHRIQAKDIVFSIVDEERGKECATVQTILMKVWVRFDIHVYLCLTPLIHYPASLPFHHSLLIMYSFRLYRC